MHWALYLFQIMSHLILESDVVPSLWYNFNHSVDGSYHFADRYLLAAFSALWTILIVKMTTPWLRISTQGFNIIREAPDMMKYVLAFVWLTGLVQTHWLDHGEYLSCVTSPSRGLSIAQPLSRWLLSSWSRTCCAGTSPDWLGQLLSCCIALWLTGVFPKHLALKLFLEWQTLWLTVLLWWFWLHIICVFSVSRKTFIHSHKRLQEKLAK